MMKEQHLDETSMPSQQAALLLTVKEVAHLLGLGQRTVWRLSSIGELPPPIRIGRSRRWRRQAIEEYVDAKAGQTGRLEGR